LTDRFGDNGIIAVVIGAFDAGTADMAIDTWLMSCRVLGRQVEQATLNLVAAEALRLGAARLTGCYRPTAKNNMVRDHYRNLGFECTGEEEGGVTRWALDLAGFAPADIIMAVTQVDGIAA
jgi:FkbH-like protein